MVLQSIVVKPFSFIASTLNKLTETKRKKKGGRGALPVSYFGKVQRSPRGANPAVFASFLPPRDGPLMTTLVTTLVSLVTESCAHSTKRQNDMPARSAVMRNCPCVRMPTPLRTRFDSNCTFVRNMKVTSRDSRARITFFLGALLSAQPPTVHGPRFPPPSLVVSQSPESERRSRSSASAAARSTRGTLTCARRPQAGRRGVTRVAGRRVATRTGPSRRAAGGANGENQRRNGTPLWGL